ncbi:ZIP family metal transporter [Arthrobacter pigmenti]
MLEAFAWGLLAGSSFLVGGMIALRWHVRNGVLLGALTGLGAGALLSAVAYELISEAGRIAGGSGFVAAGLACGAVAAAVFVSGKLRGGSLSGTVRHERGFLIVALSVTAESVILTGSLHGGHGASAAVIAAIFLCGFPEALGHTGALRTAGMTKPYVLTGWLLMTLLCGLATATFTAALRSAPHEAVAFVLAFAGGGILTYVIVHMVPEGLKGAGAVTGITTALGFGLSFGLIELLGQH